MATSPTVLVIVSKNVEVFSFNFPNVFTAESLASNAASSSFGFKFFVCSIMFSLIVTVVSVTFLVINLLFSRAFLTSEDSVMLLTVLAIEVRKF